MQSNSKSYDAAKEYFLSFVEDDFTQLGFLTGFLRRENPDLSKESVLTITKSIVLDLVKENNICVINPKTGQREQKSVEEITNEIEKTFLETHGEPDVGDGIWFGIDVP